MILTLILQFKSFKLIILQKLNVLPSLKLFTFITFS